MNMIPSWLLLSQSAANRCDTVRSVAKFNYMKKTAHQNASESKTRKEEAPVIEMSVDLSNMGVNGQS